ncbi:MAG: hypothetical protein PHO41_07365 [Eubacteriales bacterium]|nr:hypothetical protein [Eubacteriales bacterium]
MSTTEFLTWAVLGTYAGAVLFTTLITQLFKGVPLIEKLPTRIFSYIVAVIILVLATIFTAETYAVSDFVLCFVNAVIVALAANGTYDAVSAVKRSD